MVADSVAGVLPYSGGFGLLHPESGSSFAVYVSSQIAIRDAMASANAPSGYRPAPGHVGSSADNRFGGVCPGVGGYGMPPAGAAV